MTNGNAPPREGDIYKIVCIGKYTFELHFGYYEEYEREYGEPVVIYPDLAREKLYTEDGHRIVTAIQDPCEYYKVPEEKTREECCIDCMHYANSPDEIGICKCGQNERRIAGQMQYHKASPQGNEQI